MGAREMVQQLRLLAALPEDASSVPSPHRGCLGTTVTLAPEGLTLSSVLHGHHTYMFTPCTYHTDRHIQINRDKINPVLMEAQGDHDISWL